MDHDNLNIEIRKFLKTVGISSQRIIEKSVTDNIQSGDVKIGDYFELEMKLSIKNLKIDHVITDKIKIKKYFKC